MNSIVKSGRTVDEAIESALAELGMEREKVEIEVLQIEVAGFLGFLGRKQARVRATPIVDRNKSAGSSSRRESTEEEHKGSRENRPPRREAREPQPRQSREPRDSQPRESREPHEPKPRENRPERGPKPVQNREKPVRKPREQSNQPRPVGPRPAAPPREPVVPRQPLPPFDPADAVLPLASEILKTITQHLNLNVEVKGEEDARNIMLKVGGADIGQLIGRRGRTLSAVQYVISRIINEDRPNRKKISIDVDGYSETREQSLRDLAERAAEKVRMTGKPYSLRPMPAQERRVIHLELQEDPEIATESSGDEGNRYVIVYPRKMTTDEVQKYASSRPQERDHDRPSQSRGNRRPSRGRGPNRPPRSSPKSTT